MKHVSVKRTDRAKEIIVEILVQGFAKIVGIQKSIINESIIVCHEIIKSIMNSVSAILSINITNTISKNTTNTVSINSDDEKVRYKMDCFILHMTLLVNM